MKKIIILIGMILFLKYSVEAQFLNDGLVTTVSGLNLAVGYPMTVQTHVSQISPTSYVTAIAYNKNDSLAIGNKKVKPTNANQYWYALARIDGLNTNWAFSFASPIGGIASGFNIDAMEVRNETPMGLPFIYVA